MAFLFYKGFIVSGNEIVKVENIGGRQFVNARDLHDRLEVGRDFSTWIKERIEKYSFTLGWDYETCSPDLGSDKHGGQNKVEYQLSVEMAKELAILENNEKGRAVRQYLIKIEAAWNTPEMVFARALQMANKTIENTKKMLFNAEQKLIEQQPKVDTYNILASRSYLRNFRDAAGTYGMRQSDFMRLLKSKYIYSDGHGGYKAYAEYKDLFSLRAYVKNDTKGDQLMLTIAGIDYFRKVING